MYLSRRWKLTLKVLPYVLAVIIIKYLTHTYKLEFLSLSPLFTALISANIFLIGFLISGVLSDYKESEKLPGELAAGLETLYDEGSIIYSKNRKSKIAEEYPAKIALLCSSIINWLYKKEKSNTLFEKITELNSYFLDFEQLTHPPFISRLRGLV